MFLVIKQHIIYKICIFLLLVTSSNRLLANINVNISVHNVSHSFYNGNAVFYDGSISASASGGTTPYSYTLRLNNNDLYGNNNGYFTGLLVNTYQLHIVDAIGTIKDTTIIVSSQTPIPTVSITNIIVPSGCGSTDGGFTIIGSGGTPPYLFSLDGGTAFTSNNVFTNLRQGNYDGLIKDANGWLAFAHVYNPNPNPSVNYILSLSCYSCCPFNFAAEQGSPACNNNAGIIFASGQPAGFPIIASGFPPFLFSIDGINYYTQPNSNFYTFNNVVSGLHRVYIKDNTGAQIIMDVAVAKYCQVQISYVGVDASFQQSDGSISITATNGVPPYTYTMDGINYQTSNTFIGLAAGQYNFSVKDADGIINSSSATVFNKCPVISATKIDDSCAQAKGKIFAHGLKGTHPYLFSINNEITYQLDSVFIGLAAGNYKVFLKDANGFKDSLNIVIGNNCLTIISNSTSEICGNANGTIIAQASNGTPPYEYSLNGGAYSSTNIFTGLAANSYVVRAKDATNRVATANTIVSNIAGAQITAADTTAKGCSNNTGTINVLAQAGTTPYLYSINGTTFQPSALFTGLAQNNYTVTVKDALGCLTTKPALITLINNLATDAGDTVKICESKNGLTNATGNATSYAWLPMGGLATPSLLNTSANPTQTTTYYLTGTTGVCTKTDSMLVLVKPAPIPNAGQGATICFGKNASLQAGAGQESYTWQPSTYLSNANAAFTDVLQPTKGWILVSNATFL